MTISTFIIRLRTDSYQSKWPNDCRKLCPGLRVHRVLQEFRMVDDVPD